MSTPADWRTQSGNPERAAPHSVQTGRASTGPRGRMEMGGGGGFDQDADTIASGRRGLFAQVPAASAGQ